MLLRIGNIVPAMALFEIIEGMNLAGHLEPILINRVMPAFDIYAAYEPAPPQFRNNVGPVAVSESGRAMKDKLSRPVYPMPADDVPQYRSILAMRVKNPMYSFTQLRHRVDETDHLVTRLPLKAQIVRRNRIEHHLRCHSSRSRSGRLCRRRVSPQARRPRQSDRSIGLSTK